MSEPSGRAVGVAHTAEGESKWGTALARLRAALPAARGDKDFAHITSSRERVLAKYGSVFQRNAVGSIEAAAFLAFLNFKENCHWTGIHRHGTKITQDMPRLRAALGDLLDPGRPLAERYDAFQRTIGGTGRATITPILLVSDPLRYGCWNTTTAEALKSLGIAPQLPPTATWGQQYAAVNEVLLRLANDLGLSLWDLDALFYVLPRVERSAPIDRGGAVRESPTPIASVAKHPLNLILFGPPGTGKTWLARRRALEICGHLGLEGTAARDQFRRLVDERRIRFVTFHQSFSYEDFVEGIRPEPDGKGGIRYEPKAGIFKEVCERARQSAAARGDSPVDLGQCRFWKVSVREVDGPLYRDCIANGRVRIGWGGDVDYGECDDREAIEEGVARATGKRPTKKSFAVAAVTRLKKMAIGDIVLVPDALHGIRAIGRVSGGYELLRDQDRDQQSRPVEWLRVFETSIPRERLLRKALAMATIYELRRSRLDVGELAEMIVRPEDPRAATASEPHVLIIDEINRANVSKVLGELITLLEPDKRLGAENETVVTLPYSRDTFGVPPNLHIIGTMNTADRSLAFLDLALRRRFEFEHVAPDPGLLPDDVGGVDVAQVLRRVNERVELLLDRDHRIGHAYFLGIRTLDELGDAFRRKVLPLLEEYFQGDLSKVAVCLGCAADDNGRTKNPVPVLRTRERAASDVLGDDDLELEDRRTYELCPVFAAGRGDALRPYFEQIANGHGSA